MTTCGEDRIEIRNLVVTTVVGVLAHEREIAQPLRIDLSLFVDLRDAGRRSRTLVRESKDLLLERVRQGSASDARGR